MGISNIIMLLSGVALFLFGMTVMGDGLKSVAGSKLELILYRLTSTPLKGLLLGTGITAVIQSSSATSVMVVGFVNSGMMKVKQAIGIVLGAILGTSITGWILCLSNLSGGSSWLEFISTSTLTSVLAVIGIILRMFSKKVTRQHIGDILLGFAVLMFGMQTMSSAVAPLKESAAFIEILTLFENPFLGILMGLVVTCIIQSASAAVGILQALSMTGAIDFSVALPLTMGIAIGAAVPVLISAIGANVNGKRTAFVYLLIDVIGAAFWACVFYLVNAFVHFSFMDMPMDMVSVALLNTLFRLATLLLLMPFIGLLEKIVTLIFKDKPQNVPETSDIDNLEERFIAHPSLALEQSKNAIRSMANKAEGNFTTACSLLKSYSDDAFQQVLTMEDSVDHYEDKLGSYLVKLTGKELAHDQSLDVSKFLHTIGDFERISDHAVNIAEVAKEIHEKQLEFSFDANHELGVISAAVSEIVSICIKAFVKEDLEIAYRVEPLEELIDSLCDEIKLHHIRRLQTGNCTLNQGFVFNDLLTNFERVADHCSNIAVAMIELESDSFDTHEYLNSLKEIKTNSFNQYFEEYRQKYSLSSN